MRTHPPTNQLYLLRLAIICLSRCFIPLVLHAHYRRVTCHILTWAHVPNKFKNPLFFTMIIYIPRAWELIKCFGVSMYSIHAHTHRYYICCTQLDSPMAGYSPRFWPRSPYTRHYMCIYIYSIMRSLPHSP